MRAGKILAIEPAPQVEHQPDSVRFRHSPITQKPVRRAACGMRRAACSVRHTMGSRPQALCSGRVVACTASVASTIPPWRARGAAESERIWGPPRRCGNPRNKPESTSPQTLLTSVKLGSVWAYSAARCIWPVPYAY